MWFMDSVLWLLPLTVNEALKQLWLLPILMQNYSGGDTDSIVLGIISLFLHLLGSWSSPVPLQRQLVLKSFNYGVLLLEDVPVKHWNGHAHWIRGWCWCICWSCCLISWCRLRIAVGSRLRIVVGSHLCKFMQVLSLKGFLFCSIDCDTKYMGISCKGSPYKFIQNTPKTLHWGHYVPDGGNS